MPNTFEENKEKVFNFMEYVQENIDSELRDEEFRNSPKYKLRILDREEDKARECCSHGILCNIYKDAIPLGPEYKRAYDGELTNKFDNFMADRCPNGIDFYVREALKKNSPFAKRVIEAVDDFVNNEYNNKALNIENIDASDLQFKSDKDTMSKIDVIGQELGAPEISQLISDNVKKSALSEITRAKEAKENLKSLENELANDVNINNGEKVESALEARDMKPKDYIPTLFEGVMINKVNTLTESDKYLYDALDDYGFDSKNATPEAVAFTEALIEYTGLSMLNALKFESYNKYDLTNLAQEYAGN